MEAQMQAVHSIRLKPLREQVIVVVGASSGMGRGVALAAAKRGAKVVVAARNRDALEQLAEEIRQEGGLALAVQADTRHYEEVAAVAERAVLTFGRLDTWVQMAGVSIYATFEQTEPEEFQQIIDVNLVGQAFGAKAALPYLRRTGQGSLILVSSVEGEVALPYQSAYAASKHGINGFSDALRLELEHEGAPINVTTIMPAGMNTPFFDKAKTRLGVKPAPIPPVYQPETVINAILYAAENPVSAIVVGDAAKFFVWGKRFMPGLLHKIVRATGFAGQRSDIEKSDSDPNSLYDPIPGYDRVHGPHTALPVSISNWFERNPIVQKLLVGATVALVAINLRRVR